jgi:hypothetical protein
VDRWWRRPRSFSKVGHTRTALSTFNIYREGGQQQKRHFFAASQQEETKNLRSFSARRDEKSSQLLSKKRRKIFAASQQEETKNLSSFSAEEETHTWGGERERERERERQKGEKPIMLATIFLPQASFPHHRNFHGRVWVVAVNLQNVQRKRTPGNQSSGLICTHLSWWLGGLSVSYLTSRISPVLFPRPSNSSRFLTALQALQRLFFTPPMLTTKCCPQCLEPFILWYFSFLTKVPVSSALNSSNLLG